MCVPFVTPPVCRDKYDVVVVSPRNYFLYTPLLPAVATGTMEERSIVEPVRNLMLGKVRACGMPNIYAFIHVCDVQMN